MFRSWYHRGGAGAHGLCLKDLRQCDGKAEENGEDERKCGDREKLWQLVQHEQKRAQKGDQEGTAV